MAVKLMIGQANQKHVWVDPNTFSRYSAGLASLVLEVFLGIRYFLLLGRVKL